MELIGAGSIWWLAVTLTLLLLIWFNVSRLVWTIAGILLLAAMSQYAAFAWWLKLLMWIVFLVPWAVLNIPMLRRPLISDRILDLYRESMPPMSDTERDALEAGGTWWDAELFSGRPRWRRLLRAEPARLSEQEREFLDGPVDQLCSMLNDHDVNMGSRDLPAAAWDLLREKGFFGMIIPKQYGGLELSQYGHAAVVMKIASRSISAALTVMIPNSVGPGKLLQRYGTDAQKDHYLPRLASAELIPCFALTGPEAGSDAASLPDTGIVCRGNSGGEPGVLGIRLNFEKRYISLAPVANLIGVAFKMFDPDRLLGDKENIGITLALVSADEPGISIGRRHDPLHMGFHNGPVSGKDVFVPIEAIIGGREQAGKGWRMLMESLTDGRAISLPALTTASAKTLSRITGAYARLRYQFKTYVGSFEGVQESLARIAGNTYAMDAARLVTLGALDEGHKPSVISAIVKYNLTARARELIGDAMDVHGGAALCLGPRNIIGEFSKFPSVGITVEGHNILTRGMITFGQGVIRCHPYLLDEMHAVNEKDERIAGRNFDRAFVGHIGFSISNALRAPVHGLTGAHLASAPIGSGPLRYYYRQLSRMSAALAFVSDILLLQLKGELKRREHLSARMADVLSQLYIGSTVLKHFDNQGREDDDLPLAEWALLDCLVRIQNAFDGVFDNFPGRGLGWLVRRIVFPFGRSYRAPTDAMGQRLAHMLLVPSPGRNRLTSGMYLTDDTDTQLGRLETALDKVTAIQPLEEKLREGVLLKLVSGHTFDERISSAVEARLFSEEEAAQLRDAESARRATLVVDDFDF